MNPDIRRVQPQDVYDLGLDELDYDDSGRANIGEKTNRPITEQ